MGWRQAMERIRVDFPHPFFPIKAIISPLSAMSERDDWIILGPFLPGYPISTLSSCTNGMRLAIKQSLRKLHLYQPFFLIDSQNKIFGSRYQMLFLFSDHDKQHVDSGVIYFTDASHVLSTMIYHIETDKIVPITRFIFTLYINKFTREVYLFIYDT